MSNTIQIIKGVVGYSVYLNDYRIAGAKPWGGGESVAEFNNIKSAEITAQMKKNKKVKKNI